jgi:hypothetical protein
VKAPVRAAVLVLAVLASPAGASAHHGVDGSLGFAAAAPERCAGDEISPTRAISGEFSTEQQGAYVLIPFNVPAGITSVRVKYCHDQPESPTNTQVRHTLDIGLYDARRPGGLWGEREFRGWGGSSHPDVTVTPEGFSTEEEYRARPRGHVPGKTTRGFEPGPIPAGE